MSAVVSFAPDKDRGDIRWYSIRKMRERELEELGQRYAMYWNVDAGRIVDLTQHGTDHTALRTALQQLNPRTG